MTSATLSRHTSSPASLAGQKHFAWPDGPGHVGPEAVPVSRSLPLESEKEPPTTGTCGPSSSGSFASASLQSSLASRLRARMDSAGSTEYSLTWKERATPAGRQICALRASTRRTSDSGCTGRPSPKAQEDGRTLEQYESARLRGYENRKGKTVGGPASKQDGLAIAAQMAGWASPKAKDSKAPATKSYRERGGGSKGEDLNAQVVNGLTSPGGPAPTASRGVLAPEFSRWLMGYPSAWDEAAPKSSEWQSVQRELIESAGCGDMGMQ